MTSDAERREVARRLREIRPCKSGHIEWWKIAQVLDLKESAGWFGWEKFEPDSVNRLADLIEPSYKPDAEYEEWYNSLSHLGDERGVPSTIRELIEEIVWTALTVDLGPNGNTDSTGVDEGCVYTDKLFAEWESEALRLSGRVDRDALLALADKMAMDGMDGCLMTMPQYARRIREALGVD